MKLRDLFPSSGQGKSYTTAARRTHTTRQTQAGAVRVKRERVAPSSSSHQTVVWVVVGLLLLGVGGWLVLPGWQSTKPPQEEQAQEQPQAQPQEELYTISTSSTCSALSAKGSSQSAALTALITIPAGTYELPTSTSGLYPFTRFHNLAPIVVDAPFLIQGQPVSRTLFKEYADFVASKPDGQEKERSLAHLGLSWNQVGATTPAVKGISWEAALEFTQWLSQKTGCTYDIPSRAEWAATIIHLYGSGVPLPKPSDAFDATPLKSLLRGGTEWTRSPCAAGYYLVGEEDWGGDSNSNQPICMPGLFSVAGFRVVLHPTAPDLKR